MSTDSDAYLNTIARLEPDIAMIDHAAGIASIAISLKRIADAMERLIGDDNNVGILDHIGEIAGFMEEDHLK